MSDTVSRELETEVALLAALDHQAAVRKQRDAHDECAKHIPEEVVNGVRSRMSREWRVWYQTHERLLQELSAASRAVGDALHAWHDARR